MKLSSCCGVIVLLLSLFACLPQSLGQQNGSELLPPEKMRVCIGNACEDAVWVTDHYEGHQNGIVSNRYWITAWQADHIELSMQSAKAADGVFPIAGTMTGTIAPDGMSVRSGSLDWRIGYAQSGTMPFTLAWNKEASNSRNVHGNTEERRFATYQPHRVNGILIPPGASDVFASFPDDVRAILLPEHPLLPRDAVRPCDDSAGENLHPGVDATTALEIGKFALRAGEFARGYCWVNRSGDMDRTTRAAVIMGIIHMMGWSVPKDPQLAFRFFDGEYQTHDPWALYFVEQCYAQGIGVAKNPARAGQIDAYLMMHDSGQNVFMMIGADDAAVMQRYQELSAFMNPPETTSTKCQMVPVAGTSQVKRECTTSSEVDQKELQRRIDAIDRQYSNTTNQK